MPREYIVSAGGLTLANQAVSLVFINPGTTMTLEILRAWIGQSANATSAQQRVQSNTQVTAFPTLVAATPARTKTGDPVSAIAGGTAGAAGTAGVNASAEGAGAKTTLIQDAFNVLNGYLWVPTPYETHWMGASGASGWGLHLPVAPATLTNWSFGVTYRELG